MSLLFINSTEYLLIANLFSFVFCIFMVIFMGAVLSNQNNSHSRYIFKRLIAVVAICLFSDMLTYVFDMQAFFGARFLNHLTMFASVLLTVYVGSVWHFFFDVSFHIHNSDKKRRTLYLTPVALVFVLLIINLFTGMLFSIDDQNVYSRGPYAFISFFLQYFLSAVLILRAAFFKFKTKTARYAKLRVSFILVGAISLIFGVFQVLALGKIALHCYGITATIFVMLLRFQDDQITNDILTGLNNRYALDVYIEDKVRLYQDGTHGGRQLYLIMLDVNNFKRINDKYGHVEGDNALKTVARALKNVGMKYGSDLFIGRFGGDEFALLYESNSEKKVKTLCNDIKTTLKVETEDNEYLLTVGAGYAYYTGKEMKISAFYDLADKALYEDKNAMKNAEMNIIV